MTSKIEAPVAWIKFLKGAECKSDGRTYDIMFCEMPGYTPLYAAQLSPDHSGGGAGMVVPEGWKLVPIEPTQEMRSAFAKQIVTGNYNEATLIGDMSAGIYTAMLEAAPEAFIDKVKELNQ